LPWGKEGAASSHKPGRRSAVEFSLGTRQEVATTGSNWQELASKCQVPLHTGTESLTQGTTDKHFVKLFSRPWLCSNISQQGLTIAIRSLPITRQKPRDGSTNKKAGSLDHGTTWHSCRDDLDHGHRTVRISCRSGRVP
jgi:hypothetical protein